jgi:hypothetical protein
MIRVQPLGALLRVLAGPAIWFAHFILLYGAEAIFCTPAVASPMTMTAVSVAATLTALSALSAFAALTALRPAATLRANDTATFLRATSLLLALLSAIAVIWIALPTFALPVCTSPAG